ncbi:MAG TPA: hypothetical protein PKE56_15475, partial [Acidimicrobiales bacterium]|nr:hypothetical protein [Acidimicrobiales bacterium]
MSADDEPRSVLAGHALPDHDQEGPHPVLTVARRPGDLDGHRRRLGAATTADQRWSALVDLFIASSPDDGAPRRQALDASVGDLSPERIAFLRRAVADGLRPEAP